MPDKCPPRVRSANVCRASIACRSSRTLPGEPDVALSSRRRLAIDLSARRGVQERRGDACTPWNARSRERFERNVAIPGDGAYTRERLHRRGRHGSLPVESEADRFRGCAATTRRIILRERGNHPDRLSASKLLRYSSYDRSIVCADDVQRVLLRRGTPVSKATVYNTLGLFARKGLVRELFTSVAGRWCTTPIHDVSRSHLQRRHGCSYRYRTGQRSRCDTLPAPPAGTRVEGVDVRHQGAPSDAREPDPIPTRGPLDGGFCILRARRLCRCSSVGRATDS